MKNENKNLRYFKNKLKSYNYFAYKLLSSKMNNPTKLIDSLVDYFQQELVHSNVFLIKFNSLENKALTDLFVFAMTSKKEIADKFYNNFILSLKLAFDKNTNQWDKKTILEILVKNKSIKKYDLAAMTILINKTILLLKQYIVNLKVGDKISSIPLNNIFDLFEILASDYFFYELCYLIQHTKN